MPLYCRPTASQAYGNIYEPFGFPVEVCEGGLFFLYKLEDLKPNTIMPVVFIRSMESPGGNPGAHPDLWHIPAGKPPPGVNPDFVHQHFQTRAVQVRIASISCVIIAGVFVLMRIYTRAHITRKLWWDDCECAPSEGVCRSLSFVNKWLDTSIIALVW